MIEPARVILADPPWPYQNYGMAKHGAARSHYKLLDFDALATIPVDRWSLKDSVCALWSTGPVDADGLARALLQAWGFRPVKANLFTWVKCYDKCRVCGHLWDEHRTCRPETPGECFNISRPSGQCPCEAFSPKLYTGTGNYTQGGSESVWLGVKGSGLASMRRSRSVRSSVIHPRTEHSAKPEEIQTRLEELWHGPYLELFARRHRLGWTCWGEELGQWLCEEGVKDV